MKLTELCEINVGTVLSRVTSQYKEGTAYPVFSTKVGMNEERPVTLYSTVDKDMLMIAKEGDIVMSLTQQNVFIITKREEGMIIPSTFAHLRLINEDIRPEYLKWYFLHSDAYQRKLHLLQQSGGVNFLKINDLKQLDITLLDQEKQEQLVRLMHAFEKEQQLYKEKMELFQKVINDYGNKQIKQSEGKN